MNAFTPAGSNARRLIQALCAALALTLLLVLTGWGHNRTHDTRGHRA